MMRRLPFIIFALMVYALGVMLLNKNGASGTSHGQVRQPMPTITVRSLDDKTAWDASKLTGHVTVVNLFASWCTPCADEMPELAALKKQFPAIQLQGIAWNDAPKTLNPWLKKYNNPFDATWLDARGDATIALGIRGIPETLIIDSKGVMRYRLVGILKPDLREGEMGTLIQTLLDEATNAK